MNDETNDQLGPIDYIVVEWPGQKPTGEAIPILMELVEQGLIRVIDLAFMTKDEDGSVAVLDIPTLGDEVEEIKQLTGASSGLLSEQDVTEAAVALDPGTAAAVLVYENKWAAPFAAAVRRGGGQLVANGRIPIQDVLDALDATETSATA